jgi:hypothetical protein
LTSQQRLDNPISFILDGAPNCHHYRFITARASNTGSRFLFARSEVWLPDYRALLTRCCRDDLFFFFGLFDSRLLFDMKIFSGLITF